MSVDGSGEFLRCSDSMWCYVEHCHQELELLYAITISFVGLTMYLHPGPLLEFCVRDLVDVPRLV